MATNKRFNALIVEDDYEIRARNIKYLSKNGFEIHIVENGKEAIDYFRGSHQFDLVIMDLEMLIMDGYEATKEIRAMGVQSLIIGMSTSSSQSRIQEFISAGLDEFYPKPMTMAKLAAIMARLI